MRKFTWKWTKLSNYQHTSTPHRYSNENGSLSVGVGNQIEVLVIFTRYNTQSHAASRLANAQDYSFATRVRPV